jgi:MFS family permease
MFSLVNYLSTPVLSQIIERFQTELLLIIRNVLMGFSAIVGGFLLDSIGRKRMAITGFIMLGFGYSFLGIYPENLFSWYFHNIVDGAAWGMLFVIFVITIWGDLSYGAPSDKYYAVGVSPFFISKFLQLTVGEYIAAIIPPSAIFSFVAFFLFLAVIPLMYAPETLPEKKLRERELRSYIEKAKKVKEKFT